MAKKDWTKISAIASIILAMVAVFGLFLSWDTATEANQTSKRALDLQYTPQIAIEVNSGRIPTCLVGSNYSKCDYFQVFKSDIVGFQDSYGDLALTSEVAWAWPVNITFYNIGNVGTRLERIRKDFSCDPKGEGDWQVDIMKNRILLPSNQITYSNHLFFDFGEIPTKDKWCSITFKFFFFNNYTQELTYRVWYQHYDSETTRLEREAYLKSRS